MSTEENKAIVRRYIEEAVNKGNLAIIDALMSTHYRNPMRPPSGAPDAGSERYKQASPARAATRRHRACETRRGPIAGRC